MGGSGSSSGDDRIYCFGECRFIPGRQQLLHGDKPLHVGTRALDLLHALVRRPGDLVSKDELIRFAWPNTFVDASNLKVNIGALRRALPSDLPCIATVPGRGYRFVAPLRIYGGSEALPIPDAIKSGSGALPDLSSIIGRDDVLAEMADELDKTRLLTIVGPAGVGKTTVAVAAAARIAGRFKDGITFVDLAAVADPQLVAPAVAIALGVEGNPTNMLPALVEALRDRDALLVLDNCEHLLSAATGVTEHLYLALPGLRIIATSREPLRSRSETVYRLSPLQCPPAGDGIDAATAMTFPATALLVARAEARGYRLKETDAPALAAICRRLDGIALAIELAAPRLVASDPATLLGLLDHSFEPLAFESDTVPLRHRALTATLDWSYRLLSSDEARLLRHLSVFGGTFTLDDVVGAAGRFSKAVEDIAAWLDSLAAKSLLSVSYRAGGRRYRLLDSTRSFAAEQLRANGERQAALASYARYLLDLFEQAEAEWTWRTREDWTARYGHWANDLRRAIDWAFDKGGDPELGIRLTAAAIPLWNEFSSVVESRVRVKLALDAMDRVSSGDKGLKLKLTAAHASNLQFSKRLGGEAEAVWVNGRRLAVELGNIEFQLRAQFGLAGMQFFTGRHRDALSTLARLTAFIEGETDRSAAPDAARLTLMTRFHCGDIREARAGLESLQRDHVTVANRAQISRFQLDRFVAIRNALAIVSWVAGDQRRGLALAQEAVDSATALDHPVSLTYTLGLTAIPLSLWSGSLDAAQDQVSRLARTLTLHQIDTWPPFARLFQAAIDSARGDAGGVERMRAAIDELRTNNVLLRAPIYLAMLADAALRHGRLALARASIAEAFERADDQDEHWCRAELLHMRGRVQWRDGDPSGAEQSLLHAAQAAAESGALTYELRATATLARLLVREKRAAAAAELLAQIDERFDGDSGNADLTAARHLLGRPDPAG